MNARPASATTRPEQADGGLALIAIRTRQTLGIVAAVAGGWLGLTAILALLFPGDEGSFAPEFLHWLWLLPAGLAAAFALEAVGTWLLSRPLLERMSSPARILAIVLALCALAGIVFAARQLWAGLAA